MSRRTHQELVVDCLHDDLLGLVLADVEPELQHLVVSAVLDEGGVETVQPRAGALGRFTGPGGHCV